MAPKNLSLLLVLLLFVSTALVAQTSFEVKVLSQNPMVGAPIEISFELKNASFKKFYPPLFPGLTAMGPNKNRSVSYKNGKSQVIISHKYYLSATQAGNYKIGPARIMTNNNRLLKTKAFVLSIGHPSHQNYTDDQLFVRAMLDKEEVFVGEQVCLDLKIYTQVNVSSHAFIKEPPLDKLYHYSMQGFIKDSQTETYKGKQYTTKVLKRIALFPTEEGLLNIGSYTSEVSVNLNYKNAFNPYRSETRTLKTQPLQLKVKALKSVAVDTDIPIGDYQMQSMLQQSSIVSDSFFYLTLTISGQGDIKQVLAPSLVLNNKFLDVYEADIEESIIEGNTVLEGRKIFRYKIVPKACGRFKLDCSFQYFNSKNQQLDTLDSRFQLVVKPGILKLPSKAEKLKNDSTLYRPEPLVYKAAESYYSSNTRPSYALWKSIYLFLFGLPVLWAAISWRRKKSQDALKLDPKNSQSVENIILLLNKLLSEKNYQLYYQQLNQSLRSQLVLNYPLSPSKLTKKNIQTVLEGQKIASDVIQKILLLLSESELHLYAAAPPAPYADNSLNEHSEVLKFFSQKPNKKSSFKSFFKHLKTQFSVFKGLLFLFSFSMTTHLMANDSIAIQFNNAHFFYQKGQYKTAVLLYQSLANQHLERAEIYQNLGLSFIHNNQLGEGILALKKALLLQPNNKDIWLNLKLAQSKIVQTSYTAPSGFLDKIIQFLSSLFQGKYIVFWLLISWYLAWGYGCFLFGRNQLCQRPQRNYLIILAILPFVLAISLYTYNPSQNAIIVHKKVGLRSQPSLAVEESAWLYEGLEVAVIEQRENWVKVVYEQQLTGWLPSAMLGFIHTSKPPTE